MMVRILLLIILLLHPLTASMLLNENLYERDNRVDLMLSFDTPFRGHLKRWNEPDGSINLLLSDVEVQKPFYKSLRSGFVDSIAVTKAGSQSALVKILPKKGPIGLQASKTVDGFGLRLRIFPVTASTKVAAPSKAGSPASAPTTITPSQAAEAPLNTLRDDDTMPGWRYWSVIALLAGLLLLLWLIKKRTAARMAQGGWLMPRGGTKAPLASLPPEAVIRFQKPLDNQNRLILLEFGDKQYLMVVGNGNLLLDTFTEGKIEAEEDFAQMFESNKRQLDHFLKENHPDAYEAFKANASKEEHL